MATHCYSHCTRLHTTTAHLQAQRPCFTNWTFHRHATEQVPGAQRVVPFHVHC